MKHLRLMFLILVAAFTSNLAWAQQPSDEVPPSIEALRQNASSKTEFTLDHSMLVFASKLDSNDEDLRRVIAGVSGVSVHRYRFPDAGMYDPEALDAVKHEYHSAGWKQLMNNHRRRDGTGVTNLWIRFDHNAISNVAYLVAKADEVTLITVSGSISPLDLSHLGGHFGIPKIEGGVEVPNSVARR
ncbi:MAG TPA: DUF4252 domain-containing protein [Candidatus Binatia bacterium]|nr:DUF4252 domain-containing protein [Candidatus Binatia bacterium]